MSDFARLILLQDYNTRVVVIGTVALGIASGLLGVYLLLRRRALIGDAISHATLPGVALAFLWLAVQGSPKSLPILLLGAAFSGALGGATVIALRHVARIREDAALGIVLSVFFGAGVSLVTLVQDQGNAAGLEAFIYGKAASMTSEDVWLTIGIGLVIIAAICVFGKEFKILCFDATLAKSQGWPVLTLDTLLIGLVVMVTIVGLQAVGLILVIALLVIPATSARFWTHDLNKMLATSALFGAFSCASGTLISAAFPKLPSGATIVLVACFVFATSFAFGAQRGVIWRVARLWQMRREHDFQHLLRSAYEILESRNALPQSTADLRSSQPIAMERIGELRTWNARHVRNVAARMAARDLVVVDAHELRLTPRGVLEALASARDHRLLELYLVEQAELKVAAVDREADYLEHGLLPEHLAELSGVFARDASMPIPPSLHTIKPEENDRVDSAGAEDASEHGSADSDASAGAPDDR